ncbi:MAG TPA: sugar phosphate isomerase/epimerase family protein [Candidatus Dormibacteraeota bacterium]|nr:sugar phosphate isomerase/epimerase family protein [Candidatus Dormibacteraeota bacterium]
MTPPSSRRQFLAGLGAFAAASTAIPLFSQPRFPSPFRVSVITDEIAQDFAHACGIAANEFGMSWVELRGLWNKNILSLDAKEIAEALHILDKFNLRVTDIASPLFKVDWPGAPKSQFSPAGAQFNADFTFDQQGDVLDRSIALAKSFRTDRIRCFDFWRLENPVPHRAAINQKLLDAASKAGQQGIILVLENEPACNTATGAEAAQVLAAIQSPHLLLNWDPGNAATLGERPYPDGYTLLPKNRIGHCHCKDAIKKPDGSGYDWAPMGRGVIDWVGQFRALRRDGYHLAVSLETHWRGAATPEESTRQSWAGMNAALQEAAKL